MLSGKNPEVKKIFKKNKRKKVLDGYVFWSKIEKTSGN